MPTWLSSILVVCDVCAQVGQRGCKSSPQIPGCAAQRRVAMIRSTKRVVSDCGKSVRSLIDCMRELFDYVKGDAVLF